jgi:hypothetical protein
MKPEKTRCLRRDWLSFGLKIVKVKSRIIEFLVAMSGKRHKQEVRRQLTYALSSYQGCVPEEPCEGTQPSAEGWAVRGINNCGG